MLALDLETYALQTGPGVRALSMGGTQTAVPNSDSAIFYNPGVLAKMSNFYEYDAMDLKKSTFTTSDSHRGKIGPFGVGVTTLAQGESDQVQVIAFSYARAGNKGVDWGVTYKSVSSTILGKSSAGWSTDLGVIANIGKSTWVGMTLQNIVGERLTTPMSARFGATQMMFENDLTLTSDLLVYKGRPSNQIEPHLGLEYRVAPGLTFRGGWFDGSVTGGCQFQIPWVTLSYGVIQGAVGKRDTLHMLGVSVVPPTAVR